MAEEKKAQIIEAVKTPLGLLALTVLLIEAVLLALLINAEGIERLIIAAGMVITLIIIILKVNSSGIVSLNTVGFNRPMLNSQVAPGAWFNSNAQAAQAYDVFVSVPMSVYPTDDTYQAKRKEIMQLVDTLERNSSFGKTYFSGREIESSADFDEPDVAVEQDFTALKNSRLFIMVFTEETLPKISSIIVEAGYALALSKPSIYFVQSRQNLPFMLREVAQVNSTKVKIYEASDMERILKIVQKDGQTIVNDLCQ